VPFPGCGPSKGTNKISGVIQSVIVACTDSYSQLSYNAPACVPSGSITLKGLSVTDGGFGVWSYNFTVTGSECTNEDAAKTLVEIVEEDWNGRSSKKA